MKKSPLEILDQIESDLCFIDFDRRRMARNIAELRTYFSPQRYPDAAILMSAVLISAQTYSYDEEKINKALEKLGLLPQKKEKK